MIPHENQLPNDVMTCFDFTVMLCPYINITLHPLKH